MSEELELQHHGIKGQKWGIRRFQNEDGSLTEEGKKRYEDYEKQLNEVSRKYTNEVAIRNHTRLTEDARVSSLLERGFNDDIWETYKQGQKIISKMKKEGLLKDDVKIEDYIGKYESELLSKNLPIYTQYVKEQYGRDLTEADIEWMYYTNSLPDKEAEAKDKERQLKKGLIAGAVVAALGAAVIAGVLHRKHKAGSSGPSGSSKPKKKIKAEVVSTGESKVKEILLPTVVGNKLSKPVNVKFKGEPSLFGGKRGGVNGSYSYSGPLGKGYNIHTGRMRKMKHSCIELDAFLHSDDDEEELQHHGIKGQKWGERRFQNPDGSLTEEGKDRYGVGSSVKKNSAPKVKNDEKHHDNKEPKWGLRRFQKPDGSLTEEGKKRYNADSYDKMDSANKAKYDEDRRDYKLNNLAATSDILRSIGNATSAAQQIPITSGKTIRKSYPNLTDKELQERINRLSLEQRYSDLKGDTKYERSGGEKVREILQTVGASVAIAGSVAAIAATVYGMRHQIPGSKGKNKKQ